MLQKILHTLFTITLIISSTHCMEPEQKLALSELEQTFIDASIKGDIETVKDCIAKNVKINAEDKNGETALFHTCYWGRDKVAIHLLQQKNIEVNTVSKTASSKRTPLHFACSNDNPNRLTDIQQTQLIWHLIAAGANLDALNIYHETPLHCALKLPFSEPVKLLIAAGASMIARPNGLTPLQEADTKRNIEHVRALLTSKKITTHDIEDALQFNRNSRANLLVIFREKLGQCLTYTYSQFAHGHLEKLHGIVTVPIPIERCFADATIAQFNEHYGILQTFLQMIKEVHLLNNTANPMQEIKDHQNIYRVLFQYYRTQKMLELAQRPANREFPMPRLFSIPAEVRKMMPALAAQKDLA